jgi:signal transduction histidine kinase
MVNSPKFNQSGNLELLKQQKYFLNKMQPFPEYYQLERQIIQTILEVRDGQTMLANLAQKLGEFWQVDFCVVASQELTKIGWWSRTELPNHSQQFLQEFPFDKTIASLPIAKPLAVDSSTLSDTAHPLYPFISNLPNRAFLGITTQFQKSPNGIIILGKSQLDRWTDFDRDFLQIISESMAIAISQAQLQQQAQTRSKYQNLLNEITRSIAQTSEVDSIVQIVLAGVAQTLEVDRGMVLMLKYKDPLLTAASSQKLSTIKARLACQYVKEGLTAYNPIKDSFRIGDSALCQKSFQDAPQPLAIAENAYLLETAISETETTKSKTLGIFDTPANQSLLLIPLMGTSVNDVKSSLVLGFLVLQNAQPRLWQSDELDLVNWISIQASNAILRSQTLMQVQNLIDRQTAQLRWGLDLKAKLSDKMLQQIQQLQQLNKMKDDFLSSVSHELRTPLTTMKMAIQMLRNAGLPDTLRERYLNILEEEWGREYNLIKDLLKLQEVESSQFTISPQELNLPPILDNIAKSFQQQWEADKGLHLAIKHDVDAPQTLYTDAESLENILQELLLNAAKYADIDTEIKIEVSSKNDINGRKIVIAITNYGAGIAPDELSYIFDKFRRGQGVTDRAVPGTGLGLALVKYLVQHLQGTIDVTSKSVDNTSTFINCFTLSLPQFPLKTNTEIG